MKSTKIYKKYTAQYHARPFGQSRVLSILFIKAWKKRPNATGARPFGLGEYDAPKWWTPLRRTRQANGLFVRYGRQTKRAAFVSLA